MKVLLKFADFKYSEESQRAVKRACTTNSPTVISIRELVRLDGKVSQNLGSNAPREKTPHFFLLHFTLLVAFVWNLVFHNIRLKNTLFEGKRGKLNGHLTLPSGSGKLWLMLGSSFCAHRIFARARTFGFFLKGCSNSRIFEILS